jgi:hypothetical protein
MLLNIQPTEPRYTTVYFTKDLVLGDRDTFRAVDHEWYGPLMEGDAAILPVDDAEFWIRMGYASLSPPITVPGLDVIQTAIEDTQTSVESLQSEISAMSGTLTTFAAIVGIEAIAVIILAVVLLRK